MRSLTLPFSNFGRRLFRDRRGISTVEFALLAPLLLLAYVGITEIGTALTIYRRTSTVAATAADLTAQVKAVSTSDLKDIISASSSILAPYKTTPLKVVITSVVADDKNKTKVDWSYANKGSARSKGDAYTVPAGLTEPGSSVIVSEITYSYTPLLPTNKIFTPNSFDMKRTFYSRPRKSLTVAKTD
jgi:Flp pilus assembly protein TadG